MTDYNYLDKAIYHSDLGDTQVILITDAYTLGGQVYFNAVVHAFDFHSPYIYARDISMVDGRLSWGGGDYYKHLEGLEKSKKLDLSWYLEYLDE